MKVLESAAIETGLAEQGRVYLCGNLERVTEFKHHKTDRYEIGISEYTDYTFEKAHIHTYNEEYNYIISGRIKVFLLNEEREVELEAGDMFIIGVNEPYVVKAAPGTRAIFSKVPGGNDKQLVTMSDSLIAWGHSWDSKYGDGGEP